MPFAVRGDEALTAVVHVRLTTTEKAQLKEVAEHAGLSVSSLVRRRCIGRPVIASADAATIRELRRLGGLVKHLHNQSGGIYSRETADVLGALTRCIDRIAADTESDKETLG